MELSRNDEVVTMEYRALISVPIKADTDDEAEDFANLYATLLYHPGTNVIAGHVELVTEVHAPGLTPVRVVHEDESFRGQIPTVPIL